MSTAFGSALRTARSRKQMTQDALATALGVTRQSVSNWENGNNLPQGPQMAALEQALGVTLPDPDAGRKVFGPADARGIRLAVAEMQHTLTELMAHALELDGYRAPRDDGHHVEAKATPSAKAPGAPPATAPATRRRAAGR